MAKYVKKESNRFVLLHGNNAIVLKTPDYVHSPMYSEGVSDPLRKSVVTMSPRLTGVGKCVSWYCLLRIDPKQKKMNIFV